MGDEKPKGLYSCNGCAKEIPKDRARVACHTCPDYHLCANCSVIKHFSRPHNESHPTMVLKQSGFFVPTPPGSSPRPQPPLPPLQNSAPNIRQTTRISEVPTANWGALWNIMKAPLDKRGRKNRKGSVETTKGEELKDVRRRSSSMMSGALGEKEKGNDTENNASPPPSKTPAHERIQSPSKPGRKDIQRSGCTPPPSRPTIWEPLFDSDGTPTPIFVHLMGTIFNHLDTEHTGYLRPETYSSFLDVQGCDLDANTWKKTLGADVGDSSKEIADLEFSLYLSDNNISHTLSVRPKTTQSKGSIGQPVSAVGKRIRQSISFQPNMPILSKQGFIDLGAIEYLKDPNRAHVYLGEAIHGYGIWKELGAMPRRILPDEPVSKVVRPDTKGAEAPDEKAKENGLEAEEKEVESGGETQGQQLKNDQSTPKKHKSYVATVETKTEEPDLYDAD